MKVLVAVKRVVDYNVKIRVKQDKTGVEKENIKMSMNPFDEIAVEEAIRLKEKNIADEILIISIGSDSVQETIRSALAIGADKGIMVKTDKELEPLAIAKILAHFVENKTRSDTVNDFDYTFLKLEPIILFHTHQLHSFKFSKYTAL